MALPGYRRCRCRCRAGCGLVLVYIRNNLREDDDAEFVSILSSPSVQCSGPPIDQVLPFLDDLPNVSPRVYIFGDSRGNPTLLSDLQTEFGADYVKDVRTNGTFLSSNVTEDCACLGLAMSFITGTSPPAASAVGDQYRLYDTAGNLVTSGTLLDPGTCYDCPFFKYRNPCCTEIVACEDSTYTVVTGTGGVCLIGDCGTYPTTPPDTTVIAATGLVSVEDFADWSRQPIAASSFNGVTTTGVKFTVTASGGSMSLRWCCFPYYVTNFTPGEPLLFLDSGGTMTITFDRPVRAAGFRVSQATTTFRDDFFIHATGVTLSPSGAGDDLFIDATAPATDSAPFYGIASFSGCFQQITFGLAGSINSGPPKAFAISTLEIFTCYAADILIGDPPPSSLQLLSDDGEKLLAW